MSNSGRNRSGAKRRKPPARGQTDALWLWGHHAVAAALANPQRQVLRLVATDNAARRMSLAAYEKAEASAIDRLLPPGAVHQGAALHTLPLAPVSLDALIAGGARRVAVLDQVADPHNLGAIFRSAAAFGFDGVVLQDRHSPPMTGAAAKSAAGAVERVAECRVVNISRAVSALYKAGFATIGLMAGAGDRLGDAVQAGAPTAIILGAEGAGLRPGVAKACSQLAAIAMVEEVESLNVSNAAAIAFYLVAQS
ncbi:MAG: RNA methyltransferase [Pseudomonadota bacterium]